MQNRVSCYPSRRMDRSLLPGNLLLIGAECERANQRPSHPYFLIYPSHEYMSNAEKRHETGDNEGKLNDNIGDRSIDGLHRESDRISNIANYAIERGLCRFHDSKLG